MLRLCKHLRLGNMGKSAWQMGQSVQFVEAKVLYQSSACIVRTIREGLEIQTTHGILNKEDGAHLSAVWLPEIE